MIMANMIAMAEMINDLMRPEKPLDFISNSNHVLNENENTAKNFK